MATAHRSPSDPQPADVLVVFGISGDLAKVMTFRSLYRLERRGLLTCPVVGVAVDDWSTEELRQHARKAIEDTGEPVDEQVFERFAGRLSYLSGDFGDPATFQRVADAIGGATTPVFYLEIPPFLFGTVVKGLADVGEERPVRPVGRRLPQQRHEAAAFHLGRHLGGRLRPGQLGERREEVDV